jgi:hypothetical protein
LAASSAALSAALVEEVEGVLAVFLEVLSDAIAGETRQSARSATATRWTGAAESLDIVSSTF